MTENTTDTAFDIIGNALPDAGNLIEVPLIVVRDQVILPHTITPIPIRQREEANKLAAYTAIKNQQTLIFCNQKYDSDNQTLLEQLHQTGTEIAIIDLTEDSHATTMLVMATDWPAFRHPGSPRRSDRPTTDRSAVAARRFLNGRPATAFRTGSEPHARSSSPKDPAG